MENDYYVIRVGEKLYFKESDILYLNEGDAVLTSLDRAMIGRNKQMRRANKKVGGQLCKLKLVPIDVEDNVVSKNTTIGFREENE